MGCEGISYEMPLKRGESDQLGGLETHYETAALPLSYVGISRLERERPLNGLLRERAFEFSDQSVRRSKPLSGFTSQSSRSRQQPELYYGAVSLVYCIKRLRSSIPIDELRGDSLLIFIVALLIYLPL